MTIIHSLRTHVDQGFERLGHWIFKRPVKVLLVMLAMIGGLASQAPFLPIDTSFEGMLSGHNPEMVKLNTFRDEFGGSELIVLGIKHPDVFDPAFLKKLESLHKDIEQNVPYLKSVSSLIDARRTYGRGDEFVAEDLLEGIRQGTMGKEELRKITLSNPLYVNNIVSEDGHLAAVILETQAVINTESADTMLDGFGDDAGKPASKPAKKIYFGEKENTEVMNAIYGLMHTYNTDDFPIALAGTPAIVEVYNRCTQKDMPFLVAVSSLVMIVCLALIFRRVSGVILPFVIVESSLLSTLGLMSLFGSSISIMTIILPSFLIAVGVADSIHILALFFRNYADCGNKEEALCQALGHSGFAVVMTSLTTACGLLSFALSDLLAIGHLGIFASAGVMLALVYTVFMLPALLAVIPIKLKPAAQGTRGANVMDRFLLFFAEVSTSHPVAICVVSLALFAGSLYGISTITFSHDTLKYFPDSMPVKNDLVMIDRDLRGSLALDVVIDTHAQDGIYDPGFLHALERVSKEIEVLKTPEMSVGNVFSLVDILKDMNKALHGNDPEYYTIPKTKNDVAQTLLLCENNKVEDLNRLVDSSYSKVHVSIRIPWVDLVVTDRFIEQIRERLEHTFQRPMTVTITGLTALMGKILPIALVSMTKSYIIAFVLISLLMLVIAGDVKTGLVSMIPNILPISAALGILGLSRTPMDLSALMIGSIALGLVVDDTMHFMANFRNYFQVTGDARKAIEKTFRTTGRAMLITSIVLGGNFLVFTLATLKNLVTLGFFTGLIIFLALLADFLVTPAVLMLVMRKK